MIKVCRTYQYVDPFVTRQSIGAGQESRKLAKAFPRKADVGFPGIRWLSKRWIAESNIHTVKSYKDT